MRALSDFSVTSLCLQLPPEQLFYLNCGSPPTSIQDTETVAGSIIYFLLMAHFGYVNNTLPLHLPNVDPAERNESGFPCLVCL